MIDGNTGLTEDNTGLITETNEVERTTSGRKRRSKERGKDRKPRNFPLPTIKNLPQFRDKSHEEVRQYIIQKKGVDIGGNFNLGSIIIPILIVSAIAAGGYGLYWLIKQLQKRREVITNIEMQFDLAAFQMFCYLWHQRHLNVHKYGCNNHRGNRDYRTWLYPFLQLDVSTFSPLKHSNCYYVCSAANECKVAKERPTKQYCPSERIVIHSNISKLVNHWNECCHCKHVVHQCAEYADHRYKDEE